MVVTCSGPCWGEVLQHAVEKYGGPHSCYIKLNLHQLYFLSQDMSSISVEHSMNFSCLHHTHIYLQFVCLSVCLSPHPKWIYFSYTLIHLTNLNGTSILHSSKLFNPHKWFIISTPTKWMSWFCLSPTSFPQSIFILCYSFDLHFTSI